MFSVELSLLFSDDHSRVVLSLLENRPGSDYINASHIQVNNKMVWWSYVWVLVGVWKYLLLGHRNDDMGMKNKLTSKYIVQTHNYIS